MGSREDILVVFKSRYPCSCHNTGKKVVKHCFNSILHMCVFCRCFEPQNYGVEKKTQNKQTNKNPTTLSSSLQSASGIPSQNIIMRHHIINGVEQHYVTTKRNLLAILINKQTHVITKPVLAD